MKKCIDCKIEKELSEFYKSKSGKDGLDSRCKSCNSIKCKKYYDKNSDKFIEYSRKYRKDNPNHFKEYVKDNISKIKDYQKVYNKEYKKERRKNDPIFKAISNYKAKERRFRLNGKGSFDKILGLSHEQYMKWIDKNSTNFIGQASDTSKYCDETYTKTHYQIDHIIPLSSAKTEEELKLLFHYTNIQIISAYENMWVKRNKIQ